MPYTTLKPGHLTNDFNDIFEKCKYFKKATRLQDKIGLYENYNRLKPISNDSYKENTSQKDYENCIKTVKGVDGKI